MSQLPVFLMNRLNQTESAGFKLWMLYFQNISFSDYVVIITAVVVPCGSHKRLPVHRYSVISLHFLVLWDYGVQH